MNEIKRLEGLIAEEKRKLEELKVADISTDTTTPFVIGKKYFIRTVTFGYVGRLVDLYEDDFVLEDCSWVADSGRFHKVFADGLHTLESAEIERYKDITFVNRKSYIDATEYLFDLPTESK